MSIGAILQITAYGVPHMIVGRKFCLSIKLFSPDLAD